MRVGIDLDGVCYDFAASFREYITSWVDRRRYCPAPTRWEFYEDWGMGLDEFLGHCHDGVDRGIIFTYGAPLPRVAEAFAWIKAAGHSIHIVTDRSFGAPGASAAATLAWLAKYQLPYDSITFSSDKTIAAVDVMVDDKPENYAALVEGGVHAYLLTQRWNRHVPNAARVLDLLHFAEVIQ